MSKHVIAIVGGSGSGKSTLAYGIQDKYPDLVEVVHFDDYQKESKNIPIYEGMRNWDCPEAINFEGLIRDLKALKNGEEVRVMTKSAKQNPKYEEEGRIEHTVYPKEIIIVEGYLALQNKTLRGLYDYCIFLDLDFEKRMKRRTKFIDKEYTKKILIPLHNKYVEPTKKFADIIINSETTKPKNAQSQVIEELKKKQIL